MARFDDVAAFLGAIGARAGRRAAVGALLRLTAGLGGAALACGLWGARLGAGAEVGAALVGGAAIALAWAALALARDRAAAHGDSARARFVGARAPALASDLVTAVEVREALAAPLPPRFSAGLALAHVERTAVELGRLDAGALVPWRALGRVGIAALVVAAGWLVVGGRAAPAGVASAAILLGLRDPPAREADAPLLGDIRIEYRYPAYTGRAPLVVTGASGDLRALRGTEVRIEARPLRALRRAIVALPSGRVAAVLEGEHFRARFVVSLPGEWHVEGSVGPERLRDAPRRIEVEPDMPPAIDLAAPEETIEVTPRERVPFAYRATDDFGLSKLELVWRAGTVEKRRALPLGGGAGDAPREAAGQDEIDLGALTLEPGGEVAYWIEGRDNDTVGGPNVGRSRTFSLRVSSPRQHHDAALDAQKDALERAVALLGDRLETPAGAEVGAYAEIHLRFRALLDALAAARRRTAADPIALAGMGEKLSTIYGRLEKLFHEEDDALAGAPAKLASARASAQAPRQIAELERDALLLDDWIDRQRLEGLLALADDMARLRDRLRETLAQYAKTGDAALRREVERLMAELEARWREAMARAAQLRRQVPDEFTNAEAVERADVGEGLDRVREMLARGDVDGAMAALEAMSRDLDRMAAKIEEGLDEMRGERFAEEERAISEMMDKLADLESTERDIAGEAGESAAAYERAVKEAMQGRAAPVAKRALEKVEKLRRTLAEVDRDALPPFGQEEVDRARTRADETRRALAESDLEEALQAARRAEESIDTARQDARDQAAGDDDARRRTRARRSAERLADAGAQAQEIVRDLESAMPSHAELLGSEERSRLGALAGRQQAARRRAGELAREMEGKGEGKTGAAGERPKIDPQAREALGQASGAMEQAEGRMRQGEPREARERSVEAADRLARLRQDLGRSRRSSQTGDGGMSREPVRIPGEDQYRAPREWREAILEAMKEKAPESFRAKVKKYYEELIR
ncbi:MAG: DUF4175 family protein [Myxococcota bacterium]